jgi:N-acyl-D-aspartate/D-glutamate deacylase
MSEDNVRKQLRLPWVSFGSDAESMTAGPPFTLSNPHPRAYGNFARWLGKYVRDEKLVPLEEAVRRLSALPAENLGLKDRGRLAEGMMADIVIFDPKRKQTLGVKSLHMRVDYNPYEGTVVEGAPAFVVSGGRVIIENDRFVGAKGAGRFIRRGPSQAPAGL